MRKPLFATTAILFLIFIALLFPFYVKYVNAQNANFGISRIYHTIDVMRNGYVIINDTIEVDVSASSSNVFLIGFPYKYGQYVLKCLAYSETKVFPVNLNVPLGGRVGFYAVEVKLDVVPQKFTVLFVLSSELLKQSGTTYSFDFPAYPSIDNDAGNCSVRINLPAGAGSIAVAKDGEITSRTEFSIENLSAFTYSVANVSFSLAGGEFQLLDFKELKRELFIDNTGEIQCSDSYYITSRASLSFNSTMIVLPPNASNPTAYDQFGRNMNSSWVRKETGLYQVNFKLPINSYESARFNVKYSLPSQVYLTSQGVINATYLIFQNIDYYVEKASLTLTLPEGAKIVNFEGTFSSSDEMSKGVFQETLTFSVAGASYLESFTPAEKILQIYYEYDPLWLSLRPTLWVWTLAIVGCVVAFVLKRPKAVTVTTVVSSAKPLPEHVKSFVRLYEEKRKILFELDSLEVKARKGRIPRRRYKVQRKTFETRLNTLEKNLAELKEKMRRTGGLYADLMRQLEIAETEINEVETNIKSIEVRHSQGTLSLEAYRRLLADYQRRKEKAQMTINGIMLRIREETR